MSDVLHLMFFLNLNKKQKKVHSSVLIQYMAFKCIKHVWKSDCGQLANISSSSRPWSFIWVKYFAQGHTGRRRYLGFDTIIPLGDSVYSWASEQTTQVPPNQQLSSYIISQISHQVQPARYYSLLQHCSTKIKALGILFYRPLTASASWSMSGPDLAAM